MNEHGSLIPKVWLLTNAPSPYQMDLLGAIERTGRVELSVRFMRGGKGKEGDAAIASLQNGCRLASIGLSRLRDEFRIHPQALHEVRSGKYDVCVLSGLYTSLTFQLCFRELVKHRHPGHTACLLWLEQPWPEEYRPVWATRWTVRIPWLSRLRRSVLKGMIAKCDGLLCIGTAARRTYEKLGAVSERTRLLPYCCDIGRFHESRDRAATDAGSAAAISIGLSGKFVFLFSGSLIIRKGADVLIEAFNRLGKEKPETVLLLLGEGRERELCESRINPDIRDLVHFLGHRQQAELPGLFALADAFVFPSRQDGWGVVVNEACAAGLPVIATESTGAAVDLVRDGWNGFVVPRDDSRCFYEKMAFLVEHQDQARVMGKRSLEIIQQWSPEAGADIFCKTVEEYAASARRSGHRERIG